MKLSMKTSMKTLATLFCALGLMSAFGLISTTANAGDEKIRVPATMTQENVSFTYTNNRSFYHCDFVQAETEVILRRMGMQNIRVTCAGGLPRQMGNFVRAQFSTLRETTVDKSTHVAFMTPIEVKFRSSCDLHLTIVESLLEHMDSYEMVKNNTCNDSSGNMKYNMKLLN